jgi:hypothetical protein
VPRVQQPLAGDLTAVVLADVCTSVNEAFEPEQPLGRGLLMWAPLCSLVFSWYRAEGFCGWIHPHMRHACQNSAVSDLWTLHCH